MTHTIPMAVGDPAADVAKGVYKLSESAFAENKIVEVFVTAVSAASQVSEDPVGTITFCWRFCEEAIELQVAIRNPRHPRQQV